MFWWLLFVASVIFIYVKVLKPHHYWKEKNVPHNKPWPIVGNIARLTLRLTSFAEGLEDLYNSYNTRYFGFYQLLQPTLMVKDPELIKDITVKGFEHFLDHRTLISEDVDPLFGKNLFSLKGQRWRSMRSTLSPAFTSSKMRSMFILMSECANDFTDYFLKTTKSNQHLTVEMKDIFTRFANDVIATCAFGIKCNSLEDKNNEFYVMGKQATDLSGLKGLKFFGYSLSPFLMKLFSIKLFDDDVSNFFRNLVVTTINTREEKGIYRPDMINLLMEARKGNLKYEESAKNTDEDTGFATVEESYVGKNSAGNNQKLTDDDLTAQALLFFFAGFDTISTVMCHMAHELALNPDIHNRLQKEVDEAMEQCKGKVTYEAITKMKYLDMVVCESLRKWPASPITDRVSTKPYTIQPVDSTESPLTLEKGDLVWIPIFAIHRDPEHFPDPERFDPERFNDENMDKIKPLTYIPFGIGPRNCIGSRFALLEMKTIFIYLLHKFDIVVDKKTQIPLKLSKSNFNLIAEKGFWLGLKPRIKNSC